MIAPYLSLAISAEQKIAYFAANSDDIERGRQNCYLVLVLEVDRVRLREHSHAHGIRQIFSTMLRVLPRVRRLARPITIRPEEVLSLMRPQHRN